MKKKIKKGMKKLGKTKQMSSGSINVGNSDRAFLCERKKTRDRRKGERSRSRERGYSA
jgi:hypothetical protein